MPREAWRTAVVMWAIAIGFYMWPSKYAIGMWVLAAVYAILTSHKRWI